MSAVRQETIPVCVSKRAADFFKSLPADRRKLIEVLLDRTLEDAMDRSGDDLLSLAREASAQASARGLTPEILESILNEK